MAVYIFQRNFLYFPTHQYVSPEESHAHKSVREYSFKTEDGIELKAWYAPATSKQLSLIYFHGNADSLSGAAFIATPYIDAGYGFLICEYRGYSGFAGEPSEKGLYKDARACIKTFFSEGANNTKFVLFGHSLGTGVATEMAMEYDLQGLILLAPYLSIAKMAQLQFPIFPAELLTKDRFENYKKIPLLRMPLLIVNGGQDKVIPHSQGDELFRIANEPKQHLFMPSQGHNDLFNPEFIGASLDWLGKIDVKIRARK